MWKTLLFNWRVIKDKQIHYCNYCLMTAYAEHCFSKNYLRSNTINNVWDFYYASTGQLFGFSSAYENKQKTFLKNCKRIQFIKCSVCQITQIYVLKSELSTTLKNLWVIYGFLTKPNNLPMITERNLFSRNLGTLSELPLRASNRQAEAWILLTLPSLCAIGEWGSQKISCCTSVSLIGELKVGIRDFLLNDLFGVLCKHDSVNREMILIKNNK